MLAAVPFFLIFQPVETAAGFQTLADGGTEIQLAGMAGMPALGGKFAVDLSGHSLDQVDGLGNVGILVFYESLSRRE